MESSRESTINDGLVSTFRAILGSSSRHYRCLRKSSDLQFIQIQIQNSHNQSTLRFVDLNTISFNVYYDNQISVHYLLLISYYYLILVYYFLNYKIFKNNLSINVSIIWKESLKVYDIINRYLAWEIGNGKKIRVGRDP